MNLERSRTRFNRGRFRAAWLVLAWSLVASNSVAWAQSIFQSGFEFAKPALRGGSNLHWYALGPNCDREPYGIVANYHELGVREQVRAQLIEMRASGQDNVALGLYHLSPITPTIDGRVTGTILDSSGGSLHPRMRQNLVELLSDVRDAGFRSFLFRYFPQGGNDAKQWDDIGPEQAELLEQNWTLIRSVEGLLQQSGMDWGTDLLAEGMPRAKIFEFLGQEFIDADRPNKQGWSRYAREIWKRYSTEFGTARTVGFSFVSDSEDLRIDARAEHKDYVYGVDGALRLPLALAIDIYGSAERDEGWIFRSYHRHLRDEGLGDMVWVIGESYYDDAVAARALAEAMTATGQSVFYLTQWPLLRGATCDPDVSAAPPVDFSNYSRFGF